MAQRRMDPPCSDRSPESVSLDQATADPLALGPAATDPAASSRPPPLCRLTSSSDFGLRSLAAGSGSSAMEGAAAGFRAEVSPLSVLSNSLPSWFSFTLHLSLSLYGLQSVGCGFG